MQRGHVMRFVMTVIGAVAWIGFTGAMAVGNIDFMTGLVHGSEPWRPMGLTIQREWVFTAIAIAIDATLIAAPFAIAESYRDRQRVRLLSAFAVWILAIGFSLHSSHGWIEGFRGKQEAPAQQSAERRADLDRDIGREQANLVKIQEQLRKAGLDQDDHRNLTRQQKVSQDRIADLQRQKWATVFEVTPVVMEGFSWFFAAAVCALNGLVPFSLFGTIRREFTVSVSGSAPQATIVATGDWHPLKVSHIPPETHVPGGGETPPEPRKTAAKKLPKPVASQPAKLRLVKSETGGKIPTVVTDDLVSKVRTMKAADKPPSVRKMAEILGVSKSSIERALTRLKEETGSAAVA
jgi:hypothetical protein